MPDRWVSVSSVFNPPDPWEDDLDSPPSPSPAELLAHLLEPEDRHGAGQHHHDGAERVAQVRVHGTGEVNMIAAGDRFIAPSGSSPSDDGSDSAAAGGTAAAGGGSSGILGGTAAGGGSGAAAVPRPEQSEEAEPCEDIHSECTGWVVRGECTKNPDFMHSQCRRGCGLCDPDPNPSPNPNPSCGLCEAGAAAACARRLRSPRPRSSPQLRRLPLPACCTGIEASNGTGSKSIDSPPTCRSRKGSRG